MTPAAWSVPAAVCLSLPGLAPAAMCEGASCGPPPRSGRSPDSPADSFQ